MIFINFMIGWEMAKLDQPKTDINKYAQGYLVRLLIINKGHCTSTMIMAQGLIGLPKAGDALRRVYEESKSK